MACTQRVGDASSPSKSIPMLPKRTGTIFPVCRFIKAMFEHLISRNFEERFHWWRAARLASHSRSQVTGEQA
jgi:hypothetical protein